ncbi:MAG: helix-turn-helix transcriptional regulator [Rhizobiaceae bacterium]|nr:helix-turn-helix transcriptional regulator [Rhizobiaceae bacterium]
MRELPHPADITVGMAIRQKRLLAKMSQGELGDHIGVSFQQIQKYERGTNRVSVSALVDIALALETDVRRFFDEVSQGNGVEMDDRAFLMTRDTVALARAFSQIPNTRLRQKILEMVKAASLLGEDGGPGLLRATAE